MKLFLFIILFAVAVAQSMAQNTCTQRLNQAEDDYRAGRLLGIPNRLNICLETGGFSREELIRARKLLTLVYIFTDQEPEAELAMINLLKVDPEHQLDPQVDPAELYFLYDQFRVDPIFRLSLRFGATSSVVNVIQERSTDSENYPKFYNGKPSRELSDEESALFTAEEGLGIGFFGEALVERRLYGGLEIALGPQLRFTKYNVEAAVSSSSEPILKETATNRQLYIRAPLILKYTLWHDRRDKKILPYVFGGGSYDHLLSAGYSSFSRVGGISYNDTESDLKATQQVNDMNFSLTGGLGAKVRVKTHFFTAEVRYDNSMRGYNNGSNAYVDQTTLFDGGLVEDDVSLDFISFSLGFTFSIYNPVKLEK